MNAMNRQKMAQIFARANEFKEGDELIGGTRDEQDEKNHAGRSPLCDSGI